VNEIVENNSSGRDKYSDDSFLGRLHEEYFWDWDKYNELLISIKELTNTNNESLRAKYISDVFSIYRYISSAFSWHFNSADGFFIKNMAAEKISDLRLDIDSIFSDFFRKIKS
jgi:hypothetical protein